MTDAETMAVLRATAASNGCQRDHDAYRLGQLAIAEATSRATDAALCCAALIRVRWEDEPAVSRAGWAVEYLSAGAGWTRYGRYEAHEEANQVFDALLAKYRLRGAR